MFKVCFLSFLVAFSALKVARSQEECPVLIMCVDRYRFAICTLMNGVETPGNDNYTCPSETPYCTPDYDPDTYNPCVVGLPTTTTESPTTTTTAVPTTTTTRTTTSTTNLPTTFDSMSTTAATTLTSDVTPPSQCLSAGTYPSTSCGQYYACIKVMWWYEVVLKTCPGGQAFQNGTCVPVAESTCSSTLTSPVTPSTDSTTEVTIKSSSTSPQSTTSLSSTTSGVTSTTVAPPVTPPAKCLSAGIYPSASCTQYYACIKVMWWYELVLKTCPNGQAFQNGTCVPIAQTNCSTSSTTTPAIVSTTKRDTTTTTTVSSSETSSTQVISSTTTTEHPALTGDMCQNMGEGLYPAPKCNQYYKCVKVMWWFEAQLQNCNTGQSYDSTTKTCKIDASCK